MRMINISIFMKSFRHHPSERENNFFPSSSSTLASLRSWWWKAVQCRYENIDPEQHDIIPLYIFCCFSTSDEASQQSTHNKTFLLCLPFERLRVGGEATTSPCKCVKFKLNICLVLVAWINISSIRPDLKSPAFSVTYNWPLSSVEASASNLGREAWDGRRPI